MNAKSENQQTIVYHNYKQRNEIWVCPYNLNRPALAIVRGTTDQRLEV